VAEDPEAVLDGFGVVGGHLSLHYLRRASTVIKVATLDGKVIRTVDFPGIGSAVGLSGDAADDAAYFSFSSFLQPPTIYRTSVSRGGREPYFSVEVPASAEPYLLEQQQYLSRDGTQVSMFVIRRREAAADGRTPFLLLGYGGFNLSQMPVFDGALFAWLEAGGGVAITNLRGGGEYGEGWHRAGMLTHKQNVFDDFIARRRTPHRSKLTSADRLVIRGGSNGGLLVGAAMTQRPELFRAVVCQVPLLDMVRFHLFGTARGWVGEYGSVDDAEQFRALFAYSPYHRIKEGTRYPALLVMSADSDDRVDPMHARKFVASLQHASAGGRPVWLRVEAKAGHGGTDLLDKQIAAQADELAFLLAELGVTPP
jgi:prolyl oligopeptidase